jgi:hypothetical protein
MADTGFGSSITFQSGFFAQFRVIEELGSMRESIETTHNASTSGWATFIPSDIKKMKRCRVQMLFNPDDTPPIDQAAETVTITLPVPAGSSNGATVVASGFMTDATASIPYDDLMTMACELQLSGVPVWTDAS